MIEKWGFESRDEILVASISISVYLSWIFSNVEEKKENQHRTMCVESIQKSNDMN